jgi:DedD protein
MDIALKQRLVGASVLIALAVVVLPMLLGGKPDEGGGESQRIEIPQQPPELDFETRRYPIGESRPAQTEPEVEQPITLPAPTPQEIVLTPKPDNDTEIVGTETVAEELADQPPAGTESMPPSEEEPPVTVITPEPLPSAAPAGTGRYIVQVASFGSINNANRLTSQLRELGYTVTADTVSSDIGTLHRVRVGPYEDESDADRAAAALKTQLRDVTPRVMDMQPGKAAPVTKPSDPLVRWVVQVGSFSSSGNADSLVARLKLEGLSAYKESVSSGGGTIFRVRAGPYIERDEAIRVDKLINDRLSLDGVVMSAD